MHKTADMYNTLYIVVHYWTYIPNRNNTFELALVFIAPRKNTPAFGPSKVPLIAKVICVHCKIDLKPAGHVSRLEWWM